MPTPKVPQKQPCIVNLEAGTYYWCTCGESSKQPFCDGSHEGTGFDPLEFTIDAPTTAVLCACKHTETPPYCDGSHCNL